MKWTSSVGIVLLVGAAACSGDSADKNNDNHSTMSSLERGSEICPFTIACVPEFTGETAFSCMRRYTNDDYLSWIESRAEEELELVRCLSSAEDCADYQECLTPDGPACDESRCDGDVVVRCVDGRESRFDCTTREMDCVDTPSRGPACGVEGATCDPGELQCSGDIFLWCPLDQQQIPFGTNCSQLGFVCHNSICVDSPVQSCTQSTCNGSEVRYCLNGNRHTSDCGLIDEDYECVQPSAGDIDCEPPEELVECEEDPAQSDRCEGDVAVTCIDGKYQRVDCSKAGATCITAQGFDEEEQSGVYCEIP